MIAGKEYGSGSSRDWAAKGPNLLGVRAVIAESYERIHRSNLLMMGILPLQFRAGETPETLGLTGREEFSIEGRRERRGARGDRARRRRRRSRARVRLDTPREREYLRHGGILPFVLRRLLVCLIYSFAIDIRRGRGYSARARGDRGRAASKGEGTKAGRREASRSR